MPDITDMFSGLRGQEFVEQLRAVAMLARLYNASIRCGACSADAEYIGMQRCGAPGGPICQRCMESHFDYMRCWESMLDIAQPFCRHCNENVDKSHLYAVNMWDGAEVNP